MSTSFRLISPVLFHSYSSSPRHPPLTPYGLHSSCSARPGQPAKRSTCPPSVLLHPACAPHALNPSSETPPPQPTTLHIHSTRPPPPRSTRPFPPRASAAPSSTAEPPRHRNTSRWRQTERKTFPCTRRCRRVAGTTVNSWAKRGGKKRTLDAWKMPG